MNIEQHRQQQHSPNCGLYDRKTNNYWLESMNYQKNVLAEDNVFVTIQIVFTSAIIIPLCRQKQIVAKHFTSKFFVC